MRQKVMWRRILSSLPASGLLSSSCTLRAVWRLAAYVNKTYKPSQLLQGTNKAQDTKQGAAGKTVNLYLRRWCVPASLVLVLCEHSCKSMVATCIVESLGLKQPALNALLLC
jgi:hypothetical protein